MTNTTGSTYCCCPHPHTTDCSTMPSATAAITIVGRRSIPPITAAARARKRSAGPRIVPMGSPMIPARRKTARNASTAAMTHTRVSSLRTGMPSSAARSAFSAVPRTATPTRVRRNSASSVHTTGTATAAMISPPRNFTNPMVNCALIGAGSGSVLVTSNQRGSRRPAPASTCARPMVATLRISRGERKNLRITRSSTTAPSTTAATIPVANASSQLAPLLTTSSTANDAGAKPRSPCAKLRIRLARYTSAIPSEIRAVSPPSTAPYTTMPAGGPHRTCTNRRNSPPPTT